MRRRPGPLHAFVLLAALLALSARPGAGAPPAAEEAKQRAKVAQVFVEAGAWFVEHGRKADALRAIAEAKEAEPKAPGLDALEPKVAALEEKAVEDPAAVERWTKAAQEAAKGYERLAAIEHDAKDDARFDGYLAKSVELDPSKARIAKVLGIVKQAAGNQGRAVSVGRLLVRLRELDKDPDAHKRYDPIEADLARSDVALVKSPDQPLVAWVSLPKSWTPKGEWNVLVAVGGAGCACLGQCRGLA